MEENTIEEQIRKIEKKYSNIIAVTNLGFVGLNMEPLANQHEVIKINKCLISILSDNQFCIGLEFQRFGHRENFFLKDYTTVANAMPKKIVRRLEELVDIIHY